MGHWKDDCSKQMVLEIQSIHCREKRQGSPPPNSVFTHPTVFDKPEIMPHAGHTQTPGVQQGTGWSGTCSPAFTSQVQGRGEPQRAAEAACGKVMLRPLSLVEEAQAALWLRRGPFPWAQHPSHLYQEPQPGLSATSHDTEVAAPSGSAKQV